jgi:protein-disulfide isomerase
MRRLMFLVALVLAATSATARADDSFTPGQTKAIQQIVRDYLTQHPEFLMQVMQAADDKTKADKVAGVEKTIRDRHAEIFDDPTSPVGGNPKGDVTIVEFFDYRCPYCKQVEPVLEALLRQDPNIRIVYKEFPILGPESLYASQVALAARKQGKYQTFHDAMMGTKGTITDDVILKIAGAAGVNVATAETAMKAPDIQTLIKNNYALADALDINGTPAFIVGDKLVPGATDLDGLKQLVAAARHSG